MVICTDSNYVRMAFTTFFPQWKQRNFLTAAKKPVKHKNIFLACDHIVEANDMQIFWKKVRGHSRIHGTDKELNDKADSLAKEGATHGTPWQFDPKQVPTHPIP